MRGRFVIEQRLDLGGGASCLVTDTSPEMDIDPERDGGAVLTEQAGLTNVVRRSDVDGQPAWLGLHNNGRAARARWEVA